MGYDIGNQGHPADYLDLDISNTKDGDYQFTLISLIENIIEDANLSDVDTKSVLVKSTLMLHAFRNSTKFEINFNY